MQYGKGRVRTLFYRCSVGAVVAGHVFGRGCCGCSVGFMLSSWPSVALVIIARFRYRSCWVAAAASVRSGLGVCDRSGRGKVRVGAKEDIELRFRTYPWGLEKPQLFSALDALGTPEIRSF